jgi:hypothetical protein
MVYSSYFIGVSFTLLNLFLAILFFEIVDDVFFFLNSFSVY